MNTPTEEHLASARVRHDLDLALCALRLIAREPDRGNALGGVEGELLARVNAAKGALAAIAQDSR